MNRSLNLIVPMGGAGSRFSEDGYPCPKPLIKIYGKPFFYWAVRSVEKFNRLNSLTFVVLKEHVDEFRLDAVIYRYFPDADIVMIKDVLPGAVLTCLQGIKIVNGDHPVLFNDCDHLFKSEALNKVLSLKGPLDFDGALISFSSHKPQYSYIQFSDHNKIIGTVEKKVVSDRAICGAYLFKDAAIFQTAARLYLDECPYSEYYMSGVYNVMCKNNMLVKELPVTFHVSFGTPEEYASVQNDMHYEELL